MQSSIEIWHLFIFQTFTAIGTGFVGQPPGVYLVSRWFEKDRSFLIGIVSTAWSVASSITPIMVSGIITHASWRWTFAPAIGMTAVITLPIAFFLMKDSPEAIGIKPYGASTADDKEKTALLVNEDNGEEQKKKELEGIRVRVALRMFGFWMLLFYLWCIGLGGLGMHACIVLI